MVSVTNPESPACVRGSLNAQRPRDTGSRDSAPTRNPPASVDYRSKPLSITIIHTGSSDIHTAPRSFIDDAAIPLTCRLVARLPHREQNAYGLQPRAAYGAARKYPLRRD